MGYFAWSALGFSVGFFTAGVLFVATGIVAERTPAATSVLLGFAAAGVLFSLGLARARREAFLVKRRIPWDVRSRVARATFGGVLLSGLPFMLIGNALIHRIPALAFGAIWWAFTITGALVGNRLAKRWVNWDICLAAATGRTGHAESLH